MPLFVSHGHNIGFKECSAGLVVNNSAVLVDIPNLSFSVGANSWWFIQVFIGYMADAAADLRLQVTGPAGAGSLMTDGLGNARVLGTPMNIAGAGVAAELPWILTGYINPGGAAGTVKMQAAQWTAHASNMTISIGSWMAMKQLA